MFRSKQQRGFTLIELVIAIVVIGISIATVSRLIILGIEFFDETTGLQFADETVKSDSHELLRARAAYETLLAIDREDLWDMNDMFSKCGSESDGMPDTTEDWESIINSPAEPLDIGDDFLHLLEGTSCYVTTDISGIDAVIFAIPIPSDGSKLKLAISKP